MFSFKFNRPISPHVLVYTPSFSLLRSIFHRISGLILSFLLHLYLISFKFFCSPWCLSFSFFTFWIYFLNIFFVVLIYYHFVSGLLSLINAICNTNDYSKIT